MLNNKYQGPALFVYYLRPDGSDIYHLGQTWDLTVGSVVEVTQPNEWLGGHHNGTRIGDEHVPIWHGRWFVYTAEECDLIQQDSDTWRARKGTIRYVSSPRDWPGALNYLFTCNHALKADALDSVGLVTDPVAAINVIPCGGALAAGLRAVAVTTSHLGGSAVALGERSISIAFGADGLASATDPYGIAIADGIGGHARGGPHGSIKLSWQEIFGEKLGDLIFARHSVSYDIGVGDGSDGKLKADTWYCLDESGNLVEETL